MAVSISCSSEFVAADLLFLQARCTRSGRCALALLYDLKLSDCLKCSVAAEQANAIVCHSLW